VLAASRICAIVPVSDVDRAIAFYRDALGLRLVDRLEDIPDNPEAVFDAGDGMLFAYRSAAAGASRATVAGFVVEDVDAAVAGLRARGIAFEDYDLPGLKTENGIATIGPVRAAWFRDPDGNILAVEQRQRAAESGLQENK
jgi:catechol 2,3-dioxygenase-like lactoylglutathione lyase family enzyme